MGVCNNCNNCLRTENKNSMEADLSSKDFGKIKLFKKIQKKYLNKIQITNKI